MTEYYIIAVVLIALAVWAILRALIKKPPPDLICTKCGTQGQPEKRMKGSWVIELILWLCFIIPGMIYTQWRHSSRYSACPVCGGTDLIPLDSPMAKQLQAKLTQPASPAQ